MSGDRDDREQEGGEPSFKVIDRRRFAPDGSERSEEEQTAETVKPPPAQSSAPPPEQPPPAPEPGPPPTAESGAAPSGRAAPDLGEPQGAPYDGSAEEVAQPSFATLVLSLSTQALMSLGEIPEAPGVEPSADLPVARHVIDLLGVLQQKTQGNLTEDEHALLERILYDLRMRYVQLSGSQRD